MTTKGKSLTADLFLSAKRNDHCAFQSMLNEMDEQSRNSTLEIMSKPVAEMPNMVINRVLVNAGWDCKPERVRKHRNKECCCAN